MDESVVGMIFYIMDCVEGWILWDGILLDMDLVECCVIYEVKVKIFVDLYNVDWCVVGFEGFGKEFDYVVCQMYCWIK